MKKVDYEDLYEFNFLSDINVSPDGKHAFFLKHNADREKNGYKTYIYLLDTETENIRALTYSGDEKKPMWLDDTHIIFSSKRDKKGEKDETSFYLIDINGGEGKKIFTIPRKVSALKKLNEGKFLTLVAKRCEKEEEKEDYEAKDGRDLYVFDEIYFWSNGKGIRNKIRNSLEIFDPETNKIEKVSKKYTQVDSYSVSPDREKIIFAGHTYKDLYDPKGGLYLYDVPAGKTKTLIKEGVYAVGSPAFLGDEKVFFTLSEREFDGQNPHFAVLDLKTGKYEILPFKDFSVGGSLGTDSNFGGGNNKKFYDGKLYMTRAERSESHLVSVDDRGNYEEVCKGVGSVNSFDIAKNKVYMMAVRNERLTELYSFDIKTGEEKKLSSFNDEYNESHYISPIEYFTFLNRDGVELEGFLLKPAGYKEGKKYPGIFQIHGGPKSIFGKAFHHEMQIMANKGYFVFYTNPRGSDGRGSEFAKMTGNLGKRDYNDLMDFYDEVLRRYPDINPKKVGICGGSYGGFMCNYMIGHTDRFSAAASQRSISNYLTKSLTTDIGYYHNMMQLEGTPWTDFDAVWEASPLKNAHLAKTPTLFIQSDEDYRCWMCDAVQMYTALKMNGTDAKMVLFHKEHHGLSREGRPENRIDRLKEICGWFDKYLK